MATITLKQEVPTEFALRDGDAKECWAMGFSPEDGVLKSIAMSDYWEAVYLDGEFAAVWGYARESLFSAKAWVWLLTTEVASPHKALFARQSIKNMRRLFERFHEVQAIVHEEYEVSRNWLSWLGFKPLGEIKHYILMTMNKGDFRWHS